MCKLCIQKWQSWMAQNGCQHKVKSICPGKSIFCLSNCLKESKFFRNFSRKSKFFYPGPRPPQISNQIDAADMASLRACLFEHKGWGTVPLFICFYCRPRRTVLHVSWRKQDIE